VIVITHNVELMVAGVDAYSHDEIDFVDAYIPPDPTKLYVEDSGRIVIGESFVDDLVERARAAGLYVKIESQP
jgi:hypothetical protein